MVVQMKQRGGPSRHVSFLGRCQVIPPTHFLPEDPVDNYFARHPQTDRDRRKGRIHLPFRSKKSRRWSSASHEDNTDAQTMVSPVHSPRPGSVPLQAPPLSPSLPISRDGSASRLRQKLISPPPPALEEPLSPISPSTDLPGLSTPSIASVSSPLAISAQSQSPVMPLARPVAVRKPLTFGFDKEDDPAITDEPRALHPKLNVPPIVYGPSISKLALETSSAKSSTPAVLSWKEEGEEHDSTSSDDEGTANPEDDEDVFEEEELHGECTCADCEEKMLAALSPSYTPNWTRGARRKYLADRKEAQNEESRKAVRPPIWLRSEESEAAGTSKLREIRADEVDAKRGESKREVVSKKVDAPDRMHGDPALSEADAALRREVEEEVRLREEEHRLKKTRSEMRKLSSDASQGLRIVGGGARAMMRQLEEAEFAERRARIERSRSPRLAEELQKDEVRMMGAVPDVPTKPFTPPPRIASPLVEEKNNMSSEVKSSRTPSPLKSALSGTGTKKEGTASTAVQSKKKADRTDSPSRHPSPSLLIRRELTLGIPVQSNTAPSARNRQSWHGVPPPKARESASSLDHTPSSRLTSPDGSLTKLNDIAESPKKAAMTNTRTDAKKGNGDVNPARSAMVRSNSLGHHAAQKGMSDNGPRANGTPPETSASGTARPGANLRRANTTGSGKNSAEMARSARKDQHGPSPLSNSSPFTTGTAGNGRSYHSGTPVNFVEARIDKAKARARNSFKDLVARIKN